MRFAEALLRIPMGGSLSYGVASTSVGLPGASRAVGSAVAVLIPCHRVIQATGVFGDNRRGAARKQALLGFEGTRLGATR